MTGRLGSLAALLRYLGPWAGTSPVPGVSRIRVPLRGLDAYVYERGAGAKRGVYLVAPGLHHEGPDDPRLDRFCRVLARAGYVVVAPLLPDFLAQQVIPGTWRQLAVAFDHAEEIARKRCLGAVAVFSISFGSMPALELAASDAYRERVGRLILFGGFCDFEETVRFAVLGANRDPLNAPVVFANLLSRIPEAKDAKPIDRASVQKAWRAMVERTWGRMELKAAGARDPIAHELAAALGADERTLFLAGCGLDPSAKSWLEMALGETRTSIQFTDPRAHLGKLRAPVVIVHGRDDDVIPFGEAAKLSAALGAHPHRVHLTGLYGHTGSASASLRSIFAELRALVSILLELSW